MYLGELISIGVAFSWTITALVSEVATKRMGVIVANVWRLLLAFLCSAGLCRWFMGDAMPVYADTGTWGWLLLSGVVGYFFGDWCLFNSYLWIGARYGQLFMTLAPIASAFAAWISLGQVLSLKAVIAMTVTLAGIFISILGRAEGSGKLTLKLPWQGVLFGIGAGMGQGIGLVLSKIGLDAYTAAIPAQILPEFENYLPFSANLIRCIAGFGCFALWLLISNNAGKLKTSVHDRQGMLMLGIAVIFGPFLGVGFSLMAVQYCPAGIASTLMALTPIIIILPSHWFFHDPITLKGVIGAGISVAGVALFF
ncbi:MAG: DMT family transporter [Phocaeicola sp.]